MPWGAGGGRSCTPCPAPTSVAHRDCPASLAGWIISYFAGASDRDTGGEFPPCSTSDAAPGLADQAALHRSLNPRERPSSSSTCPLTIVAWRPVVASLGHGVNARRGCASQRAR